MVRYEAGRRGWSRLRRRTGRVAVVTDSAACLPFRHCGSDWPNWTPGDVSPSRGHWPLCSIVPLKVTVLGAWNGRRMGTSRPGVSDFVAVYEDLRRRGCRQIVSVHLSGQLSGTVDSARVAARQVKDENAEIIVIDSGQAAAVLGFAVLDSIHASLMGADAAQVAAVARTTAVGGRTLFSVPDLGDLHAGGRLAGEGRGGLGSLLGLRPLLEIRDGALQPVGQAHGRGRARETLAAWAADGFDASTMRAAVLVGEQSEGSDDLRELVAADLSMSVERIADVFLSPELQVHTGPAVLGVAVG